MKNYCLLICLFLVSKVGFSQITPPLNNEVKKKFSFLYVIKFKNKTPLATRNAFIAPADKDTTYAMDNNRDSSFYGLLNIDGIIVIKIKPDAKLLTLNNIFKLYNIPEIFRDKSVMVDNEKIENPQTILISKSEIENCTFTKRKNSIDIILKGYRQFKEAPGTKEIRKL